MDIIKLNDYTPPAPITYDVTLSDVNGEKTQTEDGRTYIEQIRNGVPSIKLAWKNVTQEQAIAITNQTASDTVNVSYFYGEMKEAVMTVSKRTLKLKHIDEKMRTYWDISFDLEG